MGLTKPRASQIFDLDYKQATRVITISDITLAGGAPSQVDGVSLAEDDRVLVSGQNNAAQNGLYIVSSVGTGLDGTWVRTSDGNETGEIAAGMIVMVTEGIVYHDTQWKLTTNDPIVIGITALTFVINILSQIGGANTQIQYNNSGTMGGSPDLTWNGSIFYANSAVSATGNITGNYILGNGSQLTNLNVTVNANALTGTTLAANVVNSSLTSVGTLTSVSVSGNTSSGNILTGGVVSATGNVTGGNLTTPGQITSSITTGTAPLVISSTTRVANLNVTGSNVADYVQAGSALNGTFYVGLNSATSGYIQALGNNNITANATTGLLQSTLLSATGNITGGNIRTVGQISATGDITSAGNVAALNFNSTSADLAENYVADADYPPGTVVVFGGAKEITVSNTSHDTAVAGIISTAPSYLMNAGQTGEWVLPVALTGRVPCLVQGPVSKGTVLVTGDTPGTAMAVKTSKFIPGCVVGKSLENIKTNEVKTIEVAVGRL